MLMSATTERSYVRDQLKNVEAEKMGRSTSSPRLNTWDQFVGSRMTHATLVADWRQLLVKAMCDWAGG